MSSDLWVLLWALVAAAAVIIVIRLAAPPRSSPQEVQRAEELLRTVLTEAEYRAIATTGFLEVPSRLAADRTYRIRRQGPVEVHEQGSLRMLLCLRPIEHLPPPDVVLIQKILLEADEQQFLSTANHLSANLAGRW